MAVAMNKAFHFDAAREKYVCDAALSGASATVSIWASASFLTRIGVATSDAIQIAGGAKCLASPELETEREFVLRQIRKSIHLQGTRRVILMPHTDCGAYGGLDGDAAAERCTTARNCATPRRT